MNITNSIAAHQPNARPLSPMKAASRPSSTADRRQFEEAVASSQREADIDTESASASTSASGKNSGNRKKDKSKLDSLDLVVSGAVIHPHVSMAPGVSAKSDIVNTQTIGDATSIVVNAPGDNAAQTIATAQAGAAAGETRKGVPGTIPAGVASKGIASENTTAADAALVPDTSASTDDAIRDTRSRSTTEEMAELPKSSYTISTGPTKPIHALAQMPAIIPALASGDLQAMVDAFETSVRNFEQTGASWIGSAHLTLQSSALQGASFQLVSDGRSLSILFSQLTAAPVSISRRQESQLSEALTRKLGRNVSFQFAPSEVVAGEYVGQQSDE